MIRPSARDSLWESALRHAATPGVFAALATAGFVFALIQLPQDTGLAVRLYVFVLGLVCLWLAVATISGMYGSNTRLQIELALRRSPPEPRRPVQLEEIESSVRFALSSGFDYDHRLRPLLRDLAVDRMAGRQIDVAYGDEAAKACLGDELWQEVYGQRPSAGRDSPGPSVATLRALIDALESI